MPVYNKLVRDYIPEIIEQSGKSYKTKVLIEEAYVEALKRKLQEEVTEYSDTKTNREAVEELGDILEIIHALAAQHGSSIEEVNEKRLEKARSRGAFDNRILLIDVEDK